MGIYGIYRENNGREIINCYALSANKQNNVSHEELADPSFIQKLDQQTHSVLPVWKEDVNKINDGLPITVADESSYAGQCKIQPEAWILGGKKLIEVNLKDEKYHLEFSCYYNDSDLIVTVGDTDIAEISGDNMILLKKAGTTPINIHFNETENNSSADYQLMLKIEGNTENIAKAEITLSQDRYTYDGNAKKPTVTLKLNGKTLKLDTDYMVIYSNNINIGTAKAIIVGKGNYTGSFSVYFKIVKAGEQPDSSITCKKTIYKVAYGAKPFKINATSKSALSFTSSNPKIAAVDKNAGKVTIKGTGAAIITIRAGKNSVKVTVKVSPNKQSLQSVKTSKGRKLAVKWAKDKNATGYQVQISSDRNFKKIAKQKNVTKNSYSFTKLKAGKKYYVRVRSYKKSGKETLYGAWSKVKRSGKVRK